MNPHLPQLKHTAGPWEYTDEIIFKHLDHGGGIIICNPKHSVSLSLSEAQANYKLIAAAPDLLEALLTFVDRQERGWHINLAWNNDTKKLIENAIKKAIL